MKWCLLVTGLLHTAFMGAEMFPWSMPLLAQRLSPKPANVEPASIEANPAAAAVKAELQETQVLLATVAHNAGIYNGIVAAALFWAYRRGRPAREFALLLFLSVTVAGTFGAFTISEPLVPAIQAVLGLLGTILTLRENRMPQQ